MRAPVPIQDMHHILVVDDDRRIRSLLKRYLTENGYRVTTAANGTEARGLTNLLEFDLFVLDVMMPGESGLDLTRALRDGATKSPRDTPILLLTALDEIDDRISGLEHGADDYLTKPFEPKELLLRIAAIIRRSVRPDVGEKGPVVFGLNSFDMTRGDLTQDGSLVRLTDGESALLTALAGCPGQPLSREALMERMGTDASDGRAVDVQIARLRRKIELDPGEPVHLRTVRGAGYMLMAD